jgi:hypothetical protein
MLKRKLNPWITLAGLFWGVNLSQAAVVQQGLQGEYFGTVDFSGAALNRVDPSVDFDWWGVPLEGLPQDNFSVRWTGSAVPNYTDAYTFYVQSDDGVRLWIDDQLRIDHWTEHAEAEDSAVVPLVAGKAHKIRLEYYEKSWRGLIRLSWSSAKEPRRVIPHDQLFSAYPSDLPACYKQEVIMEGDFVGTGLGIKWNHAVNKLAYIRPDAQRYYHIYLSNPDGTGEAPLMRDPALLNRHQGQHDWHPSGRGLVFAAEKLVHEGDSYAAIPGFGGYSDLWYIAADGTQAKMLYETPNNYDSSTLVPNFSNDGHKVAWVQRISQPQPLDPLLMAGDSVIKLADFVETPEPHLENIQTYQPGGRGFYEVSDFSPDDTELLFTSNFETQDFFHSQIYAFNWVTGQTRLLTNKTEYNEHPSFTPDGKSIIYMTTQEADYIGGWYATDWWLMNPDGTNKRRISYMNRIGHPHYLGAPMWALAVAWSADGTWFFGDVQTDLINPAGKVIKARLNCQPLGADAPSACDLNSDGLANISDVQLSVNQALSVVSCTTADINRDTSCNVIDVQRVVVAALGGACLTGP